jgi:hypothetical protein
MMGICRNVLLLVLLGCAIRLASLWSIIGVIVLVTVGMLLCALPVVLMLLAWWLCKLLWVAIHDVKRST